mmetsp:Transcript_3901/g.11290  ORF Transcript_3901/g.11290 Transcript_3901/m.11290 type:complete len:389 (-) Transcript_3901:239-1405(-)
MKIWFVLFLPSVPEFAQGVKGLDILVLLVLLLPLEVQHPVNRVLQHFCSHILEGLLTRGLGVGQGPNKVVQRERPRFDGSHGRGVLPLLLKQLPDRIVSRVRAELLQVTPAESRRFLSQLFDPLAHVDRLIHHLSLQHLGKNQLPLLLIGKADQEGLGKPPQNGLVHLPRPVCRTQDHDLRVLVRREAVPKGHELRLHVVGRLVLVAVPLPQHGVNLVDEDDRRLQLHGEGENRGHELLSVAEPLALQRCGPHVNEASVGLLRDSLREHGLPRPWRAVKQDAFDWLEQVAPREEIWPSQRQNHELVEPLLDDVQATDLVERHREVVRVDHIAGDDVLVGIRLHAAAQALLDLLLPLRGLLRGSFVRIQLIQSELEEEETAQERGGQVY